MAGPSASQRYERGSISSTGKRGPISSSCFVLAFWCGFWFSFGPLLGPQRASRVSLQREKSEGVGARLPGDLSVAAGGNRVGSTRIFGHGSCGLILWMEFAPL